MEIVSVLMFAIVQPVGMVVVVIKVSILIYLMLAIEHYLSLAICSPSCQNAANCSSPNVCTCLPGYNGTFCEFGKFHQLIDFNIRKFPLAICPSPCLNGGNCVSLRKSSPYYQIFVFH